MTDVPGPGWRGDVRNRIAAILESQVPEVNGRVYRARTVPVTAPSFPALLVYGYSEQKTPDGRGGSVYQHRFNVIANMVVEVRTGDASSATAEAACEAICRRVEQAILRAPELWSPADGVLTGCAGVKTTLTGEQGEEAKLRGVIEFSLAWDEQYTMAEPDTSPCATFDVALTDPALPAS